MSIKLIKNSNLLNSEAKYLTNAVNCIGVMGGGIAKQFADKYPTMYTEYKDLCKKGVYELSKPRIHRVDNGKYVINFPTMKYPGSKANIVDIIKGLQYLRDRLKQDYEYDFIPFTVAMCALGCGVGGLKVQDVYNEVEKIFKYTNWCNVEFYLPENCNEINQVEA